MDTISKERRSWNMSRIRSRDTGPEMMVRRYLHACGLRYRVHVQDLPGKPDLVFFGKRVCVFVHGCFWHGCERCIDGRRKVKSNKSYWSEKVVVNRIRDRKNVELLEALGWRVIVIWACETTDTSRLRYLWEEVTRDPARCNLG